MLVSSPLRSPLDQAAEGLEVEDGPQQRVEVGNIRDDDGGAGFADVPEDPQDTFWFSKAVVSAEGCGYDLSQVRSNSRTYG